MVVFRVSPLLMVESSKSCRWTPTSWWLNHVKSWYFAEIWWQKIPIFCAGDSLARFAWHDQLERFMMATWMRGLEGYIRAIDTDVWDKFTVEQNGIEAIFAGNLLIRSFLWGFLWGYWRAILNTIISLKPCGSIMIQAIMDISFGGSNLFAMVMGDMKIHVYIYICMIIHEWMWVNKTAQAQAQVDFHGSWMWLIWATWALQIRSASAMEGCQGFWQPDWSLKIFGELL